ncbi:hypothetical protein [Catenulispora pinisilvae]|uniref:hypothetical protein n=1 Tax=Catenulispora pinisilvae TaxID=2705253 RepID=UPI0018916891|nr:hypothetical protein [Catenulispora pinisilvae]
MADVVEQALNGLSDPIVEYLHLRFPQLLPVMLRWAGQLNEATAIDLLPPSDVAPLVGVAAELAIGIDLADGLSEFSAWLTEADAGRLLELVRGATPSSLDTAVSASPLPVGSEELAQRLVRLAQAQEAIFRLQSSGPADVAQARRLVDDLHHPQLFSFAPGWRFLRPVLDAYFTRGWRPLRALGVPVVVGHRFAEGFVVCDLVVGDALIDIKCVTQPASHLVDWIHQLLKYTLLDFTDELGIRRVGIYFARHTLLLTEPIDALLFELTGDTGATVGALREEFARVAAPQIAHFAAVRAKVRTPNVL